MIYCFDTYYDADTAKTACIGIQNWSDETPTVQVNEVLDGIQEYESGSFYKRELPCIISLLSQVELNSTDVIIVDGFVVLDDEGKLGLGGYLYNHLGKKVPIIGVAKNNFATLHKLKKEILRGESKKPLFITAIGIGLKEATNHILSMHGDYRFPTILKLLDQNSRKQ